MYKYVKVNVNVADELGLKNIRKRTEDGGYIINQADAMPLEGDTLTEKVSKCGGQLLTESEALVELKKPYKESETKEMEEETNNE